MSKKLKQSWVVTVKATVTKEIITRECTKEEAFGHPFMFSVAESEKETTDYEVVKVESND